MTEDLDGRTSGAPLSAALDPFISAYRIGGFGLAFLVLGAALTLSAAAPVSAAVGYIFAFGGVLSIAVAGYTFWVQQIRPIARAHKDVEANKEVIDAVEAAAIAMTDLAQDLRTLTLKHAEQVVTVTKLVRPVLSSLPLAGSIVNAAVTRSEEYANGIVGTTRDAGALIGKIKDALVEKDARELNGYVDQLGVVRKKVDRLLSKPL